MKYSSIKKKWILLLALCMTLQIGILSVSAADYSTYKVKSEEIVVKTGDSTRTYHRYKENSFGGYLGRQGCVHMATAIAASAFGKHISPQTIFSGAPDKRYSERYALKKIKYNNQYLRGVGAMTVTLSGQILEDMGIPVKVRTKLTPGKTFREIRDHLKEGKPVIVKVRNCYYNGLRFTPSHHALVLAGLDKKGRVILIETRTALVNFARVSGTRVVMPLREFIVHFMFSGSDSAKMPYVGTYSAAGGYILVG